MASFNDDAKKVEFYQNEGYWLHQKSIFEVAKFQALKTHFENKLLDLADGQRPEQMDTPHFTDPKLFEWLFADEILDLVEPILGPDIALFSSHFICKTPGTGLPVPWHEDSGYWKERIDPMEVCTVWFALDPSTEDNGCLQVIPGTHLQSDWKYVEVSKKEYALDKALEPGSYDLSKAVSLELMPNQASLHKAQLVHGSNPNRSKIRRCGYTMRYMSTRSKFNVEKYGNSHLIYLARGKDHAGNRYADPGRVYPDFQRYKTLTRIE